MVVSRIPESQPHTQRRRLELEVLGVVVVEEGVVEVAVVGVALVLVVGLHGVGVEDGHILEVHVGHEELVLVDLAVEGVAERHAVHVAGSGADAAGVGVVEGGELLVGGGHVGDHHEEHLHGHALLPAHGQDQAVGEAAVGLADVQGEGVLALVGHHRVVVQLGVGGAVLGGPVELAGLPGDHVGAGLQFEGELVDLHEVHAVLGQRDHLAELIELGSQEGADDNLLGLLGLNGVGP